MFQYRQVLVRLRQGDSERDIARVRLMGRRKAAAFRALAAAQGWLDGEVPLPEEEAIAAAIGQASKIYALDLVFGAVLVIAALILLLRPRDT